MLADAIGQAFGNMRAHVGRTVLTLFGIVWGTALVILLVAWGTGLRDTLVEQASSGGRRMILFFPGRSSSGVGADRGGRQIRLKRDDARLVASALPHLPHVTAGVMRWGGVYVRYRSEFRNVTTFGVEPEAAPIMELVPTRGRFFEMHDLVQHRRVAVLGAELKKRLFGAGGALGERIEVSGVGYEVIGVLARKGDQISSLGPPDDQKLFLPLTTYQTLIAGDEYVNFIGIAPRSSDDHHAVTDQVRKVLGARHGFAADDRDALTVFDVVNFIDLFRNLTTVIRVFVAAVGIVTLAIGGVGVMNILLLAVTERTAEIGLRKAVGATRADIVRQFLVEALFITGVGGVMGMALGLGLCAAAGDQGPVHVASFVSWWIVVGSAALLGAVGIAAGVWPALRAASIDPVRALRYQ